MEIEAHRFEGTIEIRDAPRVPSGVEIYEQVRNLNITFGRTNVNSLPTDDTNIWRK